MSEDTVPNCTTDGTPWLSLKIRLFKAEVVEAILYGCATWTMRSQEFSSLRTAHHKLLLRIIGFRRKDCTGFKPLSYREVLERTGSKRIETTIRKRQILGSPGPLFSKATQGSQIESCLGGWWCKCPGEEVDRRRLGRTASRKTSKPSGRSRDKGEGRKWVAFGVVVKDGQDWMTAARNVGMWHRGVDRGAEALDNAWRRADLRQSNVRRQRRG